MKVYQLIISAIFINGLNKIDRTIHVWKDKKGAEKAKKVLENYFKNRKEIETVYIGIQELTLI